MTCELCMLQYLAQKQGLEEQQEEEDPGYEMDVNEEHEYSVEESRLYGEPMEVNRSRIKRRRVRVEVPRKSQRTYRQNKLLVAIEGLDRMAQLEIVKKVVGSKLFSKYVGARDNSDSEDLASSAEEMASSAEETASSANEETEDGEGSVNEKTEDGEDVEISRPLARLRIRAVCIEEQSEDASCDLQHLDGVCPDPHFDCSRRECHINVKHPHFEPIKCCPYYWAGTSSIEDEEQALTASENYEAKNSLSILQAQGRCYKCYKEGHMARSCPKKKKAHPYKPKALSHREKNRLQNEGRCFICQKQGHLARVCPLQRRSLANRMGGQEDEEDRRDWEAQD
ncbi:hypothetical protein BC827DRAFT_1269476 [Russula dissimulans]|nr:hypothetical protein BC827DRAFT_1269476 [Russula dissimulans]